MRTRTLIKILISACLLPAAPVLAQPAFVDSLIVPWSDPARPGEIRVGLIQGSIHVQGYEGRDVYVQAAHRSHKSHNRRTRDGMRIIPNTSTGLTVEEDGNRMKISTSSWSRTVDITIRAPRKTDLILSTTNNGKITVEGIEGEIETNNSNGSIYLEDVSGSAVAYSANGKVTASFNRIVGDKPMSFVTMNGTVDVTLPASVKANARMRTDNGQIYTDFDIEMSPNVIKNESNPRRRGGTYRVKLDRDMLGKINGGGPEFQFQTLNGNIYIRKKKG